jgi:hypothetical protein
MIIGDDDFYSTSSSSAAPCDDWSPSSSRSVSSTPGSRAR